MKNRMLYERCWLCKGTLETSAAALVDGPGKHGTLAVGSPCPSCTDPKCETPGFWEIGVTAGQVEAMAKERNELRAQNRALAERVAAQSELLSKKAEANHE